MDRANTTNWLTCQPCYSDELTFAPQQHGETNYVHIESAVDGQFYRIGYPEYVFLSLLDGKTTVAHALALSARALKSEALTQSQAIELVAWLAENRLVSLPRNASSNRTGAKRAQNSAWWKNCNPFWLKVPLSRDLNWPNRVVPFSRFLLSPLGMLMGIVTILLAVANFVGDYSSYTSYTQGVLAPSNWLWLILSWLLLKVIHESAHAVTCAHYGGRVRELGIVFVLFAPLAYVDVTSSWRFSSKWQRIHVAAAGIYAELLLAAIAIFAWPLLDSAWTKQLVLNTILMASVSTLLFNANALMKFDGYYILSDLLGIPNLATESTRWLRERAAWCFYGVPSRRLQVRGWRGAVIRIYAVAAALWRLLVCVSLFVAASVLFEGAGILLGVGGLIAWYLLPAMRMIRQLWARWEHNRPSFHRAMVVAGILGTTVYTGLNYLPYPGRYSAPAVIEYTDASVIRARTAGFVRQVCVADGQRVQAGETLLILSSPEVETECQELEHSLAGLQLQLREAIDAQDAALSQVLRRELAALTQRHADIRRQCEQLRVQASVSGRVVARELQQLPGSYVAEGQELCAIGSEEQKELLVAIHHQKIDDVLTRLREQVRFRANDGHLHFGVLTQIEPRASKHVPHLALAAGNGGALPITAKTNEEKNDPELLDPHFRGRVRFATDESMRLFSGQTGRVIIGFSRDSLGQGLWWNCTQWLRQQLQPLRVSS